MEIVNRVANSPLVTINLEDYYVAGDRVVFDIKGLLFMEQILREKDFREAVRTTDWSAYREKHVAIQCTADAIVPVWAYMLIASRLQPFAATIIFGDIDSLESGLFSKALESIVPEDYTDKKIVIKGCGNKPVPASAYVLITALLRPFAASIFYGEPCSTVPVYKR